MGTKITVTIYVDTSKLDRAFEQLAERVKSGDSELTDMDGARQAVEEVIPPSSPSCYALDRYVAQLVELAQYHERQELEKLWREHVANHAVDPW